MGHRRKLIGLSRWIERTIHLPIGLAAEPGKIKLPEEPGANQTVGRFIWPPDQLQT